LVPSPNLAAMDTKPVPQPSSSTSGVYLKEDTVDGQNPANHLGWFFNPINNGIIMILGGAGFCPSTVCVYIIRYT